MSGDVIPGLPTLLMPSHVYYMAIALNNLLVREAQQEEAESLRRPQLPPRHQGIRPSHSLTHNIVREAATPPPLSSRTTKKEPFWVFPKGRYIMFIGKIGNITVIIPSFSFSVSSNKTKTFEPNTLVYDPGNQEKWF